MRNSIVGLVLAAILLGCLFALAKYDPPQGFQTTPASAAAKIDPGFTGEQQIGAWTLVCTAGPNSAAGIKPDAFGRCRVNLAYRRKDDPRQVVMVVAMRLLGPQQHLAVIVVLPPIVKMGDELDMQVDQRILKLPVSNCKDGRCVALAALGTAGETQLLNGKSGVLVFPPDATGKRGAVGVPFAGLQAAIAAMRKAEAA
jgi:invasion protein IalB